MTTKKVILITSIAFTMLCAAVSCRKVTNSIEKVNGYKPVYKPASEAYTIQTIAPRPYTNVGKINVYGNYTFQIDNDKGVHMIDCSNPKLAKKIAFILVPGISEMSVKNDILYVDNYSDLVSIDISNIQQAYELQRVKNAFVITNENAPPFKNEYFECTDPSKGPVIKWIEATIENPHCKTF